MPAPNVGLVLDALVWLPAHHLRGGATLSRQRAASCNFFIRKVALLCEDVSGGRQWGESVLASAGSATAAAASAASVWRSFDTAVFVGQARVGVLVVDERARGPSGRFGWALAEADPMPQVGSLRNTPNRHTRGGGRMNPTTDTHGRLLLL